MKGKWVLAVLILTLAFGTLLGACSSKTDSEGSASPTVTPAPVVEEETPKPESKPLTYTHYVNYDWMTAYDEWGKFPSTKWVVDNKKVTVEWVSSNGAADQKLNSMIISNDLPDVITLERDDKLDKLVDAGVLVPLDPYLDKYPNLKKWLGDETINALRAKDGLLYGFPGWATSKEHPLGNSGWAVNLKIYNELGTPKLDTMTDMYNYLKLVKEKYPDITPLVMDFGLRGFDVFYSSFGENRPKTFSEDLKVYQDGNELKSLFSDPAYKEAIQFANKLLREKLISPDNLTMKIEQLDEKIANGKMAVAVLTDITQFSWTQPGLTDKDPSHPGYKAIPAPVKDGLDPSKVTPSAYDAVGWNVSVITTAAKDPEAIFAFLDWSFGEEGQQIAVYGPPGLYWDDIDEATGVPIPNEAFKKATAKEIQDQKFEGEWVPNGSWQAVASAKRQEMLPLKPNQWDNEAAVAISRKATRETNEFIKVKPAGDSDLGIAYKSIKDKMAEGSARAITADSEEKALKYIDQYASDTMGMGFDKVLEYMNTKWHENLAKIGNP